jgi:hypothetical protein
LSSIVFTISDTRLCTSFGMSQTSLMTAAGRSAVFLTWELPGSASSRAAALSMPLTWSLR